MGICLADEIAKIISADADSVVIGGKTQIKKAMTIILEKYSDKRIIALDNNSESASSLGMIRIYKNTQKD